MDLENHKALKTESQELISGDVETCLAYSAEHRCCILSESCFISDNNNKTPIFSQIVETWLIKSSNLLKKATFSRLFITIVFRFL